MMHRCMSLVALGAGAASCLSFVSPDLARSESVTEAQQAKQSLHLLRDMSDALNVMQDAYFEAWVGTWPSAIDWTAAVTGTHIAAALRSVLAMNDSDDERSRDNTVNLYFSHLIAYYFGQDALAIRTEAFDDILWVVLGWLDTIQLIDKYNDLDGGRASLRRKHDGPGFLRNRTWYGNTWSPAFAHRARIFWDLATKGWDTELCGGGMNWNPALLPYKNAITNQLFISASINMYLYFPGDTNPSPFGHGSSPAAEAMDQAKPREPRHLAAAISAYKWLMSSGMKNSFGLYADGFHVSGYAQGSNNTDCDERNEAVYTYNQGVILSGQRGLFQVTGILDFLEHGHGLVQDVIRATGWDLIKNEPIDDWMHLPYGMLPPWRGLGRAGVLEDTCDALGYCSRDSQTFKGIYMHHLTEFCAPLHVAPDTDAAEMSAVNFDRIQSAHLHACRSYLPWLRHNAMAVSGTKDSRGLYGMWWTAGLLDMSTRTLKLDASSLPHEQNVTDYRNRGVPDDRKWLRNGSGSEDGCHMDGLPDLDRDFFGPGEDNLKLGDPNRRGRGRTVETQGGALQVLRAVLEITGQIVDVAMQRSDL